ncbi:MAG: WXG100 family type VII secretion target [Sciscionella sp.]
MGSPTKGFRVDPDKLSDVADQVKGLLDDLSGNSGYIAGNLPRYQENAGADVLTKALASFWDGDDVFAQSYKYEHGGIVTTMQQMVKQLTALEKACRDTAKQYQHHDKQSKTDVKTSDNGAWT